MNGHVRKNLPNALDHQKFAMASKIVITMRMKRNVASTVCYISALFLNQLS
jgi:hypothetical protein